MNVWFVRANGPRTAHNEPSTPDYVPGEPPVWPETAFNYRDKCLSDGFARAGWPNTGDLRQPGLNRLAVNGYTLLGVPDAHRRYLAQFSSIVTGDLILMPAYTQRYAVHVGIAVQREPRTREITSIEPGLDAYYYFHDVPRGEWYECAHRVDVLWGSGIHQLPELGGTWLKEFGHVIKGRDAAIEIATRLKLPVST